MIKFKNETDLKAFKFALSEIKLNDSILKEVEKKYLIKKTNDLKISIDNITNECNLKIKEFEKYFGVRYSDYMNINTDELQIYTDDLLEVNNDITHDEEFIVSKKDVEEFSYQNFFKDNKVPYDLVSLPSKGKIGPIKKDKIPVAYLTAEDEDIITSPNLYEDDKVIDYLLSKKILDPSINIDKLHDGDGEAILIWLRATAYGNMYPINVYHPKTGKYFDAECDLSKLKMKEFNLEPDENGLFEFTLPISKDVVKFKFITIGESRKFNKLIENNNKQVKKVKLTEMSKLILNFINDESILTIEDREKIVKLSDKLLEWADKFDVSSDSINNYVTSKLLQHLVSINGNSDKQFIKDYIKKMYAGDSLAFRRYIANNEPGMDLTFNVDVPADLGGGQVTTFLEIDSSIFVNIT